MPIYLAAHDFVALGVVEALEGRVAVLAVQSLGAVLPTKACERRVRCAPAGYDGAAVKQRHVLAFLRLIVILVGHAAEVLQAVCVDALRPVVLVLNAGTPRCFVAKHVELELRKAFFVFLELEVEGLREQQRLQQRVALHILTHKNGEFAYATCTYSAGAGRAGFRSR